AALRALSAARSSCALRASATRLSASAARKSARACAAVRTGGASGTAATAASARIGKAPSSRIDSVRTALPGPMVGMAGDDAGRAEKLLEQHRPRKEVRPGGAAEGDQAVGRCSLL